MTNMSHAKALILKVKLQNTLARILTFNHFTQADLKEYLKDRKVKKQTEEEIIVSGKRK